MPRGGRRPGAGAPKGNLNNVVRGYTSKQILEAIGNALQDPRGRARVLDLVRQYRSSEE